MRTLSLFVSFFFISIAHASPIPQGPVLDVNRGQSYLTIQSDSQLDPIGGRFFLVSIVFRFDRLPEAQVRQTIVSKITDAMEPSGWAIGISRSATGVRPAFFWRDVYGSGGWYFFDRTDIQPKTWYALTVVGQPGNFLNLFVEPLGLMSESRKEAKYAGGFGVHDVGIPLSDQDLVVGALRQTRTSFRGQIASILVAWPSDFSKFQSFGEIGAFLSGGPEEFMKKLDAAEINLWLNQGLDHSRYHRSVTLHGQATWEEALQSREAQSSPSS